VESKRELQKNSGMLTPDILARISEQGPLSYDTTLTGGTEATE
jgi:hypothetical protein